MVRYKTACMIKGVNKGKMAGYDGQPVEIEDLVRDVIVCCMFPKNYNILVIIGK